MQRISTPKRCKIPSVIPVRQVIPDAVAAMIRKAPLTPEKVVFAWRSVVGAAIDHATAVEWSDGVLRVRAKDAAWQREVERSAALIRARLDALLGERVVRYIDVKIT
jgi:Dna[CI] antecedent, DciA